MNPSIQIIVNGFPETVPAQTTLWQLITRFQEGDTDLIVEHNGRFVFPKQYPDTIVAPGDRVEFINPNFGG